MFPISSEVIPQQPWLLRVRHPALILLSASLASTIVLKIANVQLLELIYLADLMFILWIFAKERLRATIFRPYFNIAIYYGIFMVAAVLLSVLALRQNFYPFREVAFLKQPLLMTLSRVGELVLDVFYMLYLANVYRQSEKLCILGMKTYYWVGMASTAYSIVSYPLNILYGWNLGTYFEEHRMRGFYNEGGPYGVYLITVLVVGAIMRRRNWLTRGQQWWGVAVCLCCMVLSQSKSALSFLPVMLLIDGYIVLPRKGRLIVAAGFVLGIAVAIGTVDFGHLLENYELVASRYRILSRLKSKDVNFVVGRVAGAVMTPRMIAQHPLAGIGWGNYGLVRDDPEYRRGAAFTLDENDMAALGEVDYIVDLGIPLWLYLTWVELRPFRYLLRRRANIMVLNLALTLPLSVLFGAHLNLTYQWVVGGFALGIGYNSYQRSGMEKPLTFEVS